MKSAAFYFECDVCGKTKFQITRPRRAIGWTELDTVAVLATFGLYFIYRFFVPKYICGRCDVWGDK